MTTYLHRDFVQDILIDGFDMYSVSYNGKVIKHALTPGASSPVVAVRTLGVQSLH